MMIPLVGTDGPSYDFNITTLPKTVGFKIWFQEPKKGLDGVYPDDPAITKNIDETSNGATFGDLTIYPLYTLTITTTAGGTTNPAPGSHQYPYNTLVSVMATPNAMHEFDHWELDTVDVGTDNPYQVLMNSNHTLEAIFVNALSVTISPSDTTINLGDSVTFNSVVTGGTTPYSYQWYLDTSKVPSATSSSWAFTPTSAGTYYVYLNVTDYRGRVAISNTARVIVKPPPAVGGYSISLKKAVSPLPLAVYVGFLFGFSIMICKIKRKKE
jgi:hypothetical protein